MFLKEKKKKVLLNIIAQHLEEGKHGSSAQPGGSSFCTIPSVRIPVTYQAHISSIAQHPKLGGGKRSWVVMCALGQGKKLDSIPLSQTS